MMRVTRFLLASAAAFAALPAAGGAWAGEKEIPRQVSFGGSCVKCELSGRNLSGARIVGANFSGANMMGANLRDAKFHASNFAGADLTKADLSDSAMSGANFSGANLTGADATGANLYEASFRGANLIDAKFGGNAARWINHACNPNCKAEQDGQRVFIEARRDIPAGTELFYDYGLVIDERYTPALKKRFECRCGSKACRGTMLAPKRGSSTPGRQAPAAD